MSFSPETENTVELAINKEYENACKIWGDKYNSPHEAYAVLLEEVEEVESIMRCLKCSLEYFWKDIKKDILCGKSLSTQITDMYIFSKNAMKELAQVGAVLKKIQNTVFGEVK